MIWCDELQIDEMCLVRDKSASKVTPRLRTVEDGDMTLSLKVKEDEVSLSRCCLVPKRRYSVFDVLTTIQFVVSHACTESSADEMCDSALVSSCGENDMYRWVSSA